MKSVVVVAIVAAFFTSLVFSLAGCGVHVTSDPVIVKHEIVLDPKAFIDYCEMACEGNRTCFEDCANRFLTLISDPQICVDLNTCPSYP